MGDDLNFKHPFKCIISGPTGSGKTSFCIKFLQHLDSLSSEANFKGGITWCFSEKTAVPSQQLALLKTKIKYHEGVPEEKYIGDAHSRPSLPILDDLLNQVYSIKCVTCLQKAVIIEISALFPLLRICFIRGVSVEISLNAKHLVLLKNVRNKKQFSYLARQMYPENSKSLYKAYLDATTRPHGYLILDLSQDTDNRLGFRTTVFPSEHPPIIYAAVADDEKDQIQLLRSPSPKIGRP
jgi:hypothetical protein